MENLYLSKEQRSIKFIEATKELISTEGIEDISIRKIAEFAGYHNSTIYSHFKDFDYLISLACVPFFNEYAKSLVDLSSQNISAYDRFFEVWRYFCVNTFENPLLFKHFFFGAHKNELSEIFISYYSYFPEEKKEFSKEIEAMYFGNTFYDRCMRLLAPLVYEERCRIKSTELDVVNKLIVSSFKGLLYELCEDKELSVDIATKDFLKSLHIVVDLQ